MPLPIRSRPVFATPMPSIAPAVATAPSTAPRSIDVPLQARPAKLEAARPRTAALPGATVPARTMPSAASPAPPRREVARRPSWERPSRADKHPFGNAAIIARHENGQTDALTVLKQTVASIRRADRADLAMEQLDRLEAAAARSPDLRPNNHVYTAAVAALGEHGQLDLALEMYEHMRARGPELNVHTYAALFNACERNDAPEHVQRLLLDGVRAGVFDTRLGHDASRNLIDFHAAGVLASRQPLSPTERSVPACVARAIFDSHAEAGRIRPGMTLVTGAGKGIIREMVGELLEARGLRPVAARTPAGRINPGCLSVAAGVAAVPREPPAAASPAHR